MKSYKGTVSIENEHVYSSITFYKEASETFVAGRFSRTSLSLWALDLKRFLSTRWG